MFSQDAAVETIERLRYDLRRGIRQSGLDPRRLPGWTRRSAVRIGWIAESLVAVFEAAERDVTRPLGPVRADTAVLFDIPDFQPEGAVFELRDSDGLIILVGGGAGPSDIEPGESADRRTTLNMPARAALFNAGYGPAHGPLALFNMGLHASLQGAPSDVVAARFLPFALYIHERELAYPGRIWESVGPNLLSVLRDVAQSAAGDYYAGLAPPAETTFGRAELAVATTKERGVIVLGAYSPADAEVELRAVCSALISLGYEARLIKDFAEIPMMSNEEKVRLWCAAARFCVMVDRTASGHVLEYGILRDQRVIAAFLRPEGGGSTFMIGDASLVDVEYIKSFCFRDSAVDVLPEVVEWAEEFVRKREKAYNAAYPWR